MSNDSLKKFYGHRNFKREFHTYAAEMNMSDEDIRNLAGKKILLVGGGASPIKKNLNDIGIACHITNIDVFYSEKNPDNADTLITDNFLNRHIVDEYDEVWASHSLPLHSDTEYEYEMFWTRALLALKPGGTLRVTGWLEPKHTNFFQKFNAKFPNTPMNLSRIPFIEKIDGAKINNEQSTEEFIKSLSFAKAADAVSRANDALPPPSVKSVNYLQFTAPPDKSGLNDWLFQNLRELNTPQITTKHKRVR